MALCFANMIKKLDLLWKLYAVKNFFYKISKKQKKFFTQMNQWKIISEGELEYPH